MRENITISSNQHRENVCWRHNGIFVNFFFFEQIKKKFWKEEIKKKKWFLVNAKSVSSYLSHRKRCLLLLMLWTSILTSNGLAERLQWRAISPDTKVYNSGARDRRASASLNVCISTSPFWECAVVYVVGWSGFILFEWWWWWWWCVETWKSSKSSRYITFSSAI